MKKWFGIALALSLVLAGFAVVSPVYAQSGSTDTGMPGGPWGGPGGGPGGFGQPEDAPEYGLMEDYMLEYLAETYNLDVTDAQARLDQGEMLSDILLDAGVEDVPQAMWDARNYAFEKLAEEGYGPDGVGQEDGLFSRMFNRMRDGFNLFNGAEDGENFPPRFSQDDERPNYNYNEDGCMMEDGTFTPRGRGGRR